MSPSPTTRNAKGPELVVTAGPGEGVAGARPLPRAIRPPAWLPQLDLVALILPALILGGWIAAYEARILSRALLPGPLEVLRAVREWMFGATTTLSFYSGTFWGDAGGSVFRVGVGFAVAAVAAIILGMLVAWFPFVERLVDPTVQVLRPIPRTAFLPFAVILFGLGNLPALFLVTYGTFLLVYVQVVIGVKLVPRDLKRAARMLGATDRTVLFTVVLPAALPAIFTGLRVAIAYSWMVLILAEMLAVGNGLGYILWHGYEYGRVDLVVAGMIMIGIFGFLSDRVILVIMKRKLDWATAIAETEL
jgi:NitT/TauT family transport system permease protein